MDSQRLTKWVLAGCAAVATCWIAPQVGSAAEPVEVQTLTFRRVYSETDRLDAPARHVEATDQAPAAASSGVPVQTVSHPWWGLRSSYYRGGYYRPYGFSYSYGYGWPYYRSYYGSYYGSYYSYYPRNYSYYPTYRAYGYRPYTYYSYPSYFSSYYSPYAYGGYSSYYQPYSYSYVGSAYPYSGYSSYGYAPYACY